MMKKSTPRELTLEVTQLRLDVQKLGERVNNLQRELFDKTQLKIDRPVGASTIFGFDHQPIEMVLVALLNHLNLKTKTIEEHISLEKKEEKPTTILRHTE